LNERLDLFEHQPASANVALYWRGARVRKLTRDLIGVDIGEVRRGREELVGEAGFARAVWAGDDDDFRHRSCCPWVPGSRAPE
jgi:hypothetical protein